MEIFLVIIALMVIFIPNNNEPSPFSKFMKWQESKAKTKEAIENTGDIEFILKMINSKIDEDNNHQYEFYDGEDIQEHLTNIDPFELYIFHGGCLSCNTPKHESIAGCYGCTYYNLWDGEDKSKKYDN